MERKSNYEKWNHKTYFWLIKTNKFSAKNKNARTLAHAQLISIHFA
jgi:hypothetical protein